MVEWLEAAEAARRLGVKPATLYAYVSRGQVRRRAAHDGRRSLYHAEDIAALAVRGRRARPVRPSDVVVASAITHIGEHGPRYRGALATELAGSTSFEEVAARLWQADDRQPWHAPDEALAAVRTATAGLPPTTPPAHRIPLAVAAARNADPLAGDLRPSVVTTISRGLIALLAATAARPDDGSPAASSVAGHLTRALTGAEDPGTVALVDAALVLLADHELAASTLAARVAASARCDPYAVVLAGTAVASGPRHGAASSQIEQILADVADGHDPADALARRRSAEGLVPAFGHPLYPDGDPRATRLLELLVAAPAHDPGSALERVLAAARQRGLPPPNVDAALGGLTHVLDAPVGSGELLFTVARTAGWVAHALEQYADPRLLRPEAVYTGG